MVRTRGAHCGFARTLARFETRERFVAVLPAGAQVRRFGGLVVVMRLAEEALAFHIEGLLADGEPIPAPSSRDAVMSDPGNRDAVAVLVSGDAPTAHPLPD
jgi:HicB_like antitoxin of bacterial toxin-antitoxin system